MSKRQFVHTPPRTISPILLKRNTEWITPGAVIFLQSGNTSKASFRIRQWRNLIVCFLFAVVIGVLALLTHALATWMHAWHCLSLTDGLLTNFLEDTFTKEEDDEDRDERRLEAEWNWDCVPFNDSYNKLGWRLFVPSIGNFAGTLICALAMAWLIVSEMTCSPSKLPETKWEAWLQSSSRTIQISRVFGVVSAILFTIFMELSSPSQVYYAENGHPNIPNMNTTQDWKEANIRSLKTLLGMTSSFIFGCLFYSCLDNKLLISFHINNLDWFETACKVVRDSFHFSKDYFGNIALLLLSCYIVSYTAPANPPQWIGISSMVKLNVWWGALWIMYNFAYHLSEAVLNQELKLPADSRQDSNFDVKIGGTKRLHLADGMCLSNSDGDEYEAYLKHLTVLEFYRTCTVPSRTKALFLFSRPQLPTGFERTVDAAFFILDSFREILREWMKAQGVVFKDPIKLKPKGKAEKMFSNNACQHYWGSQKEMHCQARKKANEACYGATLRKLTGGKKVDPIRSQTTISVVKENLSSWTLLSLLLRRFLRGVTTFLLLDKLVEWNLRLLGFQRMWKRTKLAFNYFKTNWITEPFKGLTKPDEQIRLQNILKQGQFQVVSWVMAGVMEATCQSILLDKNGIAQVYVKQILPAYLDLYETLSQACEVLEKDEKLKVKFTGCLTSNNVGSYKGDDAPKKKNYAKMNYQLLKQLKDNCKFSLARIHQSFKNYYTLLEIEEECRRKVVDVIY